MNLTVYHVDAFTDRPLRGNPAAVYILDQWLPDALMQQLAAEHNLSETVFCVPINNGNADYDLRWFTPTDEVNLCGHATLSAAFILFEHKQFSKNTILFDSKSGILKVSRAIKGYTLDFPSWEPIAEDVSTDLAKQLGITVNAQYRNTDVLLVTDSMENVQHINPSLQTLSAYGARCVIISAPGKDQTDFVSRVFCPDVGVPEDPVTGSAHCLLTPYWSARLNKAVLQAKQISARGGDLYCELKAGRVNITGQACLFLKAEIDLSGIGN